MCTKRGLHLLSVDPKWTLIKADMFICSFKSSRVESTESNHLFDAGYIFMKLGCTQKDSQFQTLDTIGQWYMLIKRPVPTRNDMCQRAAGVWACI